MNVKSLILAGALTLSSLGLGIASAKSFDVILSSPTMAGNTALKPGEYRLKVEGSQAVFREAQSSKEFTVPVKIENANKKFDRTTVESTNQNGMDNIQSIDLGGSNTKLDFGR